jgi:hypothetical protein
MAMEHVIVRYPSRRRVFVDSEESGFTNEVLFVDEGVHQFDLGSPKDYEPESQTVEVTGTTPTEPMEIVFVPTVAAPEAPAAGRAMGAAATRARAPKRGRKPKVAKKSPAKKPRAKRKRRRK